MADGTFNRAERGKYTLEEKDALGNLCEKCKLEYDKKLNIGYFYENVPPPCQIRPTRLLVSKKYFPQPQLFRPPLVLSTREYGFAC